MACVQCYCDAEAEVEWLRGLNTLAPEDGSSVFHLYATQPPAGNEREPVKNAQSE